MLIEGRSIKHNVNPGLGTPNGKRLGAAIWASARVNPHQRLKRGISLRLSHTANQENAYRTDRTADAPQGTTHSHNARAPTLEHPHVHTHCAMNSGSPTCTCASIGAAHFTLVPQFSQVPSHTCGTHRRQDAVERATWATMGLPAQPRESTTASACDGGC